MNTGTISRGFLQAGETFEKMKVENVWLAWTEDPGDELAGSLRAKRLQARQTVNMAIEHLGMLGAAGQDSAGRLRQSDGLFSRGARSDRPRGRTREVHRGCFEVGSLHGPGRRSTTARPARNPYSRRVWMA